MERIFFHDVLNSAGGISGLSSIMQEIQDPIELSEISKLINRVSDNLVGEIQSQRQLNAAERGDLTLTITEAGSLDILKQLGEIYSKHEVVADKKIVITPASENVIVKTDQVLLKRILGNMVKNAIEASSPASAVTLGCTQMDNAARFSVHNSTYMPRPTQLQLFKRSFTTKRC